jgi:hypothetical protein
VKAIIGAMRIARLLFACAIPFALAYAQNQDVIRPGDILTLKFQDKWGRDRIQRTLVVAADGKITPPWLEGTDSLRAFTVEGFTLNQAAQKLQEYIPVKKPSFLSKVTIERGTVGQLLAPELNFTLDSPR